MKGIIDRFEGDVVVVEIDGNTRDFAKSIFPSDAQVGDVVIYDGSKFTINKDETKLLAEDIQKLADELFE